MTMKSIALLSPFALIALSLSLPCICSVGAFAPSPISARPVAIRYRHLHPIASTKLKSNESDEEGGSDSNDVIRGTIVPNDMGLDVIRGDKTELSDDVWDDIEGGAPSRWMVMKNLLGINIFTYILAAFIVFFLSMNAGFGPGWLGQSLGWEDVGTFTKVSDSLPLNVDVSGPDYLL